MASGLDLYKRELAELVADGCTDDEIVETLVERHGELWLMLRVRMYDRELTEQARREEWEVDDA
jgi:cytochrome c-type biogenesis protein CcmH/NrfF